MLRGAFSRPCAHRHTIHPQDAGDRDLGHTGTQRDKRPGAGLGQRCARCGARCGQSPPRLIQARMVNRTPIIIG